jgi:hypothetical protein
VRWKAGRFPADLEQPIELPPIRGIIVPHFSVPPVGSHLYIFSIDRCPTNPNKLK